MANIQTNNYPEYGGNPYSFSTSLPVLSPIANQGLNAQLDIANQFQQNIPQYSKQLYNQAAQSGRKQLAQNIKQTNEDYNRRGLLRSGMRQGAVYGAQAQNAENLANNQYQINQGLLNTSNNLNQNAINTGYQIAGMGADIGGSALSGLQQSIANQISNQQLMQGAYGSVGTGVGGLLGYYLGSNNSKPSGAYTGQITDTASA